MYLHPTRLVKCGLRVYGSIMHAQKCLNATRTAPHRLRVDVRARLQIAASGPQAACMHLLHPPYL
jgi:hypothetical protein